MLAETLQDFAIKYSDPLVEKARKGDEKSFSRLMSLWYKRIFNFCFKYFADHDLAMEVTQKTFISVHKGLKTLKDPGSFKPWLYKVALNKCHEEERRRKKTGWLSIFSSEKKLLDEEDRQYLLDQPAQGAFFNPEENLEKKELGEVVLDCLGELPEEQKVVMIMKEYEGLKFREIAEVLSISENTAKSRLYYGLKAMKNILEERNISKETMYYDN